MVTADAPQTAEEMLRIRNLRDKVFMTNVVPFWVRPCPALPHLAPLDWPTWLRRHVLHSELASVPELPCGWRLSRADRCVLQMAAAGYIVVAALSIGITPQLFPGTKA